MPAIIDLTGMRFGMWTVLRKGCSASGKTEWHCVCDCGTEAKVIGRNLCNGRSKSCGCRRPPAKHRPLHNTYRGAKRRCENPKEPNYHNYGGRGIRFLLPSYDEFEKAMLPSWFEGASLDRRDNDGDYSMDNVRWATQKQQSNNTRRTRSLTFNGETKTCAEWCDHLGINAASLHYRLANGWSVEDALSTPFTDKFRRKI